MPPHSPPNLFPAPSAEVLSILASLSSQHTQTSDFLCPFPCQSQQRHPQSTRKRRARRSASASSSAGGTRLYNPNAVPPKYEQGEDGSWAVASEWSLHGIEGPAQTKEPHPPSDIIHPDLDETNPRDGSAGDRVLNDNEDLNGPASHVPGSVGVDVVSMYDEIARSLPTGWKPLPERSSFYSVPLIIVISLIIAIVVTLLITGVVLSHKTGRRSKKAKDIEKEIESNHDIGISDEDLAASLKRARKKEKLWMRWRKQSQGKFGLRRRTRRMIIKTTEAGDQDAVNENDTRTPRLSCSSSRTELGAIQHDDNLNVSADQVIDGSTDSTDTPSETPPLPAPHPLHPLHPLHPPAYRRRRTSALDVSEASFEDDLPLSYNEAEVRETVINGVPLHAHVATDDKAVLERMRQGASAPEPENASEAATTSAMTLQNFVPHVPIWEDEHLDEDELHEDPSNAKVAKGHHQSTDGLNPQLPPPPKAGHLHRHLDDPIINGPMSMGLYMTEFPIAGPSSPPVQTGSMMPSAPPPEDDDEEELTPSAPVLQDEDEDRPRLPEHGDETDIRQSSSDRIDGARRTDGELQQQERRPRGRERPHSLRNSVTSALSLPRYEP